MPILKHIPINKWTKTEIKIAESLNEHQTKDTIIEELSKLKNKNKYYSIEYSEFDKLFLHIYKILP